MDADLVAKLLRVALSNGTDGERLAALGRIRALAAEAEWEKLLGGLSKEDMQRLYEAGYERGTSDARQPDWHDTNQLPSEVRELQTEISTYWGLERWHHKFAWWPTRVHGTVIWCKWYWRRLTEYSGTLILRP